MKKHQVSKSDLKSGAGFFLGLLLVLAGCMASPESEELFRRPDPPENLVAMVDFNGVELDWTAPETAVDHYIVYFTNLEREEIFSDTTSFTEYSIHTLSPGLPCYVAVSSVNEYDIESAGLTPVQGQRIVPGLYELYPADGRHKITSPEIILKLKGPEKMEFGKFASEESLLDSIEWSPFNDSTGFALPCSTSGYYSVFARFMDNTGFMTGVISDEYLFNPDTFFTSTDGTVSNR